jgi:hypothetical protein
LFCAKKSTLIAVKYFSKTFEANSSRIRVVSWAGTVFSLLLLVVLITSHSEPGKWVTTWSGVVQRFQQQHFLSGMGPPLEFRDVESHGVLNNQTVRMTVRSTVSGNRVRIRLSNAFGKKPLTVGASNIVKLTRSSARKPRSFPQALAHLGQQGQEGMDRDLVLGNWRVDTVHAVTFNGQTSMTIAPAGIAVSDPIDFEVRDREFLSVSLYLPSTTEPGTVVSGVATAQFFQGNVTAEETPSLVWNQNRGFWLSSVDVFASRESKAIMILDDDSRCCDLLRGQGWGVPWADRLLANGGTDRFAVLENSVAACPMLENCPMGVVARIEEAAKNRSGVQWVIVAAGFEDIIRAGRGAGWGDPPTDTRAEDLTNALKMVSDTAHFFGFRIGVVTYPPFDRSWRYTDKSEDIRQAVNQWIRDSRAFDTVLDFDRAVSDRKDPRKRFAVFDGQASAFYGFEGFRAMSDLIDPRVFTR